MTEKRRRQSIFQKLWSHYFKREICDQTIKINYGNKISILPKTFQNFQKRTKINVQNGKFEKLLRKILQIIKIPKNLEVFFSHEDGLNN